MAVLTVALIFIAYLNTAVLRCCCFLFDGVGVVLSFWVFVNHDKIVIFFVKFQKRFFNFYGNKSVKELLQYLLPTRERFKIGKNQRAYNDPYSLYSSL